MEELSLLRFDALAGYARKPHTLLTADEREWYSEAGEKVLGTIVQDRADKDYVCIVLGRDRIGRYRAVHLSEWFKRLREARAAMPGILAEWGAKDPAEFEQGDEDEDEEPMEFFQPVHPVERLDLGFRKITEMEEYSPARGIMAAMMPWFKDPDGNFVEQFQSTGFNGRFWELYLFALLAELRHAVNREHPAPDFLCRSVFGDFFIEAVTANPTMRNGRIAEPNIDADNEEELSRYMLNYLPIKFAGPLTAKLKKKYWEKPHINGRPVVFAIVDFHRPFAMVTSQTALTTYLYGRRFDAARDFRGNLIPASDPVAEHVWGQKKVPSGFFNLPDAENISAVISSREATLSKFNRIGFKAGFGSPRVRMIRDGTRYVPDRNRREPEHVKLSVNAKRYRERWEDGLEVYHNPNANIQLDPRVFPTAMHNMLEGDDLVSYTMKLTGRWFGSVTHVTLAE
jgi:hypothetical protein